MGVFKIYLLRVISVAFICSIIKAITGKTAYRNTVQFLLAIVLLTFILQPLSKLQTNKMNWQVSNLFKESEAAVNDGVRIAEYEIETIISERTSAYIVEKAAMHGAEVTATVHLDDMTLKKIEIAGNVTPYIRSILSAWIESELGVSREAQSWK